MFHLRIAFALSAGLLCGSQAIAQSAPPAAKSTAARLAAVKSWGYQLQKIVPSEIAASPFDLIVIDYSRNGTDTGRFTAAEIKSMQLKPDGGRRFVLAYLSIGEAEDYRFYWDQRWVERAPLKRNSGPPQLPGPTAAIDETLTAVRIPRLVAPGWLGRENELWSGNYLVRFWYEGWQAIIMHGTQSYLTRIQDAGFDGVYLDRVDAYYAIEQDREDSIRRMVDFVVELATIARGKRPGFIVVPQNAEELLKQPKYLAAIDGVAKEDWLFGITGEGHPNTAEHIQRTAAKLQPALEVGLPVLAVDYIGDPQTIRAAEGELRTRGSIPYFGPRKLDRLNVPEAATAAVPPLPK